MHVIYGFPDALSTMKTMQTRMPGSMCSRDVPSAPLAALLGSGRAGTGGAKGMVAALVRLSKDNLSNLTPHLWYNIQHHSHPTVTERVTGFESYAER